MTRVPKNGAFPSSISPLDLSLASSWVTSNEREDGKRDQESERAQREQRQRKDQDQEKEEGGKRVHESIESLVPEWTELFDPQLLSSYERDTLQRRLEKGRRYVRQLLQAARTLRVPRQIPPPAGSDAPLRENPFGALLEEVMQRGEPGLKRRTVQGILGKMGRHYLWTNLASLPLFHEITALLPWWAVNNVPSRLFRQLADFLSRELLNGLVLNLQRVQEEVLSSQEVYLAHCACRSAGIAHDLYQEGRVFTLLSKEENRLLLDRLVDRYLALGPERLQQTTAPKYRDFLGKLVRLRQEGSAAYRLETFLEWSYPDWEILPLRPGYTGRWLRSMQNNNKCHPVDRELVLEMTHIFFFSRGAIFNSMKCVDSPYSICTCPSPENEGGCVLTNWYYYGQMNYSLIPAHDHYGCRQNKEGQVLPCRFFPIRARRECIGCGCQHSLTHPRDLRAALEQTEQLLSHQRQISL